MNMVLNTLVYIALVIIVIIVIVLLLRFLFGVLFIIPTSLDHQAGKLPVSKDIPTALSIQYNPTAYNIAYGL
jgi:hypothetical protein